MVDKLMDLVTRPDIKGPELVKEIMKQFPGSDIDTVLTKARRIIIERHALTLKSMNFETIFDLIKYIHNFNLTFEDFSELVTLLSDHNSELKSVMDSGLLNSIHKFTRPVEEPVKPPPGCFCF
jgi:hypothetical protein